MGQDGFADVYALVIHNVCFMLQCLARTLQDTGILNVHSAPNVMTACTIIENCEAQPDLFVTNFQALNMNGVELL